MTRQQQQEENRRKAKIAELTKTKEVLTARLQNLTQPEKQLTDQITALDQELAKLSHAQPSHNEGKSNEHHAKSTPPQLPPGARPFHRGGKSEDANTGGVG